MILNYSQIYYLFLSFDQRIIYVRYEPLSVHIKFNRNERYSESIHKIKIYICCDKYIVLTLL